MPADDHYAPHYRDFADPVHADVRRAAFGDDIGQNSWLTREELDGFGHRLELGPSARLLDVACGSGGPALHLVRQTGCTVVGIDHYDEAVANGRRIASEAGLEGSARFVRADASEPLPFDDGSFDAILCIDAINHLPDRGRVLADWLRLMRPGGRLLFTDPVVVTGVVSGEELATRASIGSFLFVPAGEDERLLTAAGLRVLAVEDTTAHLTEIAHRRRDARAARADALRQIEGAESFAARQRFFDVVAALALEGRMSRFAYVAERPA